MNEIFSGFIKVLHCKSWFWDCGCYSLGVFFFNSKRNSVDFVIFRFHPSSLQFHLFPLSQYRNWNFRQQYTCCKCKPVAPFSAVLCFSPSCFSIPAVYFCFPVRRVAGSSHLCFSSWNSYPTCQRRKKEWSKWKQYFCTNKMEMHVLSLCVSCRICFMPSSPHSFLCRPNLFLQSVGYTTRVRGNSCVCCAYVIDDESWRGLHEPILHPTVISVCSFSLPILWNVHVFSSCQRGCTNCDGAQDRCCFISPKIFTH